MKLFFVILSFLVISVASIQPAYAGTIRFGADQSIVKISDLSFKGPKGEEIFLAHVVTTQFFILGLYVKDDGYALGIKGERKGFYPFPEAEKVKQLQALGILSDPLPEYKLKTFDYVIGYSLWIFLAAMLGWGLLKSAFSRKKSAPL
ncbi:MAG: hypothetical protein COA45_06590 [Zetaproteobacteria bacterium]|nr:MAG: hypothetical protein COA45_06590 [Zetaproteobacteria bacterium]